MTTFLKRVVFAVVALVLADAFMEKFGGDHVEEARRNYLAYLKTVAPRKLPSSASL